MRTLPMKGSDRLAGWRESIADRAVRAYLRGMAEDDDDQAKKKPRKHRCGNCFGEGGEWIEPNGEMPPQRKWVACRACKGSGWQDE